MNLKIKHLVICLLSLALLFATLFVPMSAKNTTEMKKVQFGFPLNFVAQDFSSVGGFQFFPRYFKFDPKNKIENFSVVNSLASLLAIFLAVEALVYVLETLDFKIRQRFGSRE